MLLLSFVVPIVCVPVAVVAVSILGRRMGLPRAWARLGQVLGWGMPFFWFVPWAFGFRDEASSIVFLATWTVVGPLYATLTAIFLVFRTGPGMARVQTAPLPYEAFPPKPECGDAGPSP